jgi:murein L,D-transpeptidase YafK
MKSILLFTSVFLGSSLVASNVHTITRSKTLKSTRFSVAGPVGNIRILIDKSDYELSVYDEKGWYATYPVVFGNNSLGDKKMQGDRQTPEGTFNISYKRVHDKWCRFMLINYPTAESVAKFNMRKQRGEIPASAKIGGDIGIHGTWPHDDYLIDKYKNWTEGCISMKNDDVKEVYSFTRNGASVTIRK